MKLRAILLFLNLTLLSAWAFASSNGSLEWKRLSFCDAGNVCVDISVGDQGDSVAKINAKLKQGDHSVDLSDSLNRVQGKPWINGTQLITVYASGTELVNKISIPFLSIENGKVIAKKTVVITVSDGKIVNIEESDTYSRSKGAE